MDKETIKYYRDKKKSRKKRHSQFKVINTNILESCGLEFSRPSLECYLFRGNRPADFYPSTGRWKDIKTGKMHKGGAGLFITWLTEEEK